MTSKLTVDEVLRIAFAQNPSATLLCGNCVSVIGEAKSLGEAKAIMEKHWETCPHKIPHSYTEKLREEMK
jgi:rRNA processing protein Krr1/Pno1